MTPRVKGEALDRASVDEMSNGRLVGVGGGGEGGARLLAFVVLTYLMLTARSL